MSNRDGSDRLRLFKALRRAHWRVEIGRSGHYKIWNPHGRLITTTPSSASDTNSFERVAAGPAEGRVSAAQHPRQAASDQNPEPEEPTVSTRPEGRTTMTEDIASVDIYPVGVLAELLRLRRALTNYDAKAAGWAVGRLQAEMRSVGTRLRQRDWRAVKNKFNGYLAEPTPFPDEMRRCGSGWTKKRAMRSLRRHGCQG